MASQEMGLEMGMDFEVEEKEERAQRRRFLWIGLVCALLVAALAAFALMRSGGPGAGGASGSGAAAAAASAGSQAGDQEASSEASAEGDDAAQDKNAATAEKGEKGDAKGANGEGKDGKGNGEKAPVPVSVAVVEVAPISTYLSATANLVPEGEVKVLAEAEGRVAQLRVEEGDRVERGAVLASLVRDEAEISFTKAKLRNVNAELALARSREMVEKELVSREAFDKAKMEAEIAGQELAEAQWRLDKTTIRAPFTGRVTVRTVSLGQHVRPGDELFTVADFDPLIARIYLPEKDVLGLEPGRSARITLKADETVQFAGRIRQVSPVVDTATGTVKLTIEAVEPPAAVRPGAFVAVDIIKETHTAALLVPRQAVVRELASAHVFVRDGEKAVQRAVTLGFEEGDRIEALSGLKAGEQVVVAGQGSLKDGARIRALDELDEVAEKDKSARDRAESK